MLFPCSLAIRLQTVMWLNNQSFLQSELKLREDLAAFKKNVDNMFLITMGIFVFCKFLHFFKQSNP
jgi:hypothetical protein